MVALPFALWILPFRLDLGAAAFGFAGGVVGGFGLILFYRAMAMNLIGVVAPVSAVVAAAIPVMLGVVVGGERLHLGQVGGIVLGLAAIALINGGGGAPTKTARTAVGLAIVAGIGFGLFFVFNHAGSSGGVTTFVSGRFASALASFCFALFSRVSPLPRRSVLPIIAIGGSFDGIGVVLYLFATFHGLLSLSAVLTSFYPAFTVLCARLFIGEKLAAVQLLGAVLAIAAVALIAAT